MAKKAIVMGATSGIGMEVAKLLAAKGWQVGIAGRRIERLQTLISDNKTTLQSGGTISDNKATPQGGIICYQLVDTAFNWFATHHQNNSKARIACITSIAGTKGLGAAPAYSATKRFQNHYLECLTQQARMRHLPISITDIRPGFVKTDLIAGSTYPLQLQPEDVAKHIVRAIEKGKEVKVIDWRYAILVFFWHLIPRGLWTRLRITT